MPEMSEETPVKITSPEPPSTQRIEVHIPFVTFLKVAAALIVTYVIYVLWPLLLLIFLAIFLAVTLHACVDWLIAREMKPWASQLIVIAGLLTFITLGISLIFPALIEQATAFSHNFPKLREQALHQLPVDSSLRHNIEHMFDSATWSEASDWFGKFISVSGIALSGLSELVLLLVIALYLLIDGAKTYEWLLAFFSPLKRAKLRLTAEELSNVIFGYVAGQAITSLLVMIYTFTVLSILHVPGALMLAILAGVFDVLPILGIFISTAPAFLLALSVSPETAFIVLGLYLLFHAIEAYYIVPRVYGKNLRVSTLTVRLGLLSGALLAGIPGAIAALPLIASYAAVERIWLKPFLRDGVAEKHELQKDQEFGEKA
jgi:predicted PurR-regulated permease PerM